MSAADQNLDRQLEVREGVDKLFAEKRSGKNRDRPELKVMLAYVREGDAVRVNSTDRLARSLVDLLNICEELEEKGVTVEFVDNPRLSTNTAHGKLVLTTLGAVAEFERAITRERQVEGTRSPKPRGSTSGHRSSPRSSSPTPVSASRSRSPKRSWPGRELGLSC